MLSPRAYNGNGKVSFRPALPSGQQAISIALITHVTFYMGTEGYSKRISIDFCDGTSYTGETFGNCIDFQKPILVASNDMPAISVTGAISADISVKILPASAFGNGPVIGHIVDKYPPKQDEDCIAYYRRLIDATGSAPDPQEIAIALFVRGYKHVVIGRSTVWRASH